MGVAHCFLGTAWADQVIGQLVCRVPLACPCPQMQEQEDTNSSWALLSFMRTSEFLYFHSVLIGLQVFPGPCCSPACPDLSKVMNFLFFLGTVHFLVDHWRKAAGVIKSEVKANFLIVLKLIVIMGNLLIALQLMVIIVTSSRSSQSLSLCLTFFNPQKS